MNTKTTLLALTTAIGVTICSAGQQPGTAVDASEVRNPASIRALKWPYFGFRTWMNGFLVSYAWDGTTDASPSNPSVFLYDDQGRVAREAVVWFDGSSQTGVSDAAVGKSGEFVVAGGTTSADGTIANFIAKIGPDGKIAQSVRTTPFLPLYVCVADDDTVWAFGVDRDDSGKEVESSLRLRQYGFLNGQLRAMLAPTELGTAWGPLSGRYSGEVSLRCSAGQVVLFNAGAGRLIQVDAKSGSLRILHVNPLPTPTEVRMSGFAVTESGDIFASFRERGGKAPLSGIFRLTFDDSGISSWTPLRNSVGPYLRGGNIERLLGTDGTNLVYTSDSNGTTHWAKYHP